MFRTHAKATLPSADAWYTSHTIIKDPPKSVHTRRINRVGETSLITQEIDDSGDRIAECILQYPRGQNVMVGTNYNNFAPIGRNQNRLGGRQAFLPYRVAVQGAFRPPVQTPTDLLPLSRMPRNWTQAITNPQSADFTRRLIDQCPTKDMRQIKQNMIYPDVHATAVYSIARPAENVDVLGKVHTATASKGSADARVFKLTELDNVYLDTSKFISDTLDKGAAESKVCLRVESEAPAPPMRLRDPLKVDAQSNRSGVAGSRDIILDGNVRLPERRSRGGFENSGVRPTFDFNEIAYTLGDGKMNIQRAAQNLQFEAGV